MKYDAGKLEGGYRLFHIQRTKRYLFAAQAVIILVFAAYLLYAEGGFEMTPFYLSINSFIYFVLIMLLVVMVESFVFIILELKFMRSSSAKFIITRRSIRTSLLWAAVSLLGVMLLWAPILPEMVEQNMDYSNSVTGSSATVPAVATFFNSDPLGLTGVATIDLTANGLAEVFILTEENYDLFKDGGKAVLGGYRVNPDYQADPEIHVEFPDTDHSRFYILVYSLEDGPVTVDYTITKNVSTSLLNYLPILLLMFFVGNAFWAAYMFNTNKHYVAGIYR